MLYCGNINGNINCYNTMVILIVIVKMYVSTTTI